MAGIPSMEAKALCDHAELLAAFDEMRDAIRMTCTNCGLLAHHQCWGDRCFFKRALVRADKIRPLEKPDASVPTGGMCCSKCGRSEYERAILIKTGLCGECSAGMQ